MSDFTSANLNRLLSLYPTIHEWRYQFEKKVTVLSDYHLPELSNFNLAFCLNVISGKKKLLKISSMKSITLPKTKYVSELQKISLFKYVQKHPDLNKYIPNDSSCDAISRDFLINV